MCVVRHIMKQYCIRRTYIHFGFRHSMNQHEYTKKKLNLLSATGGNKVYGRHQGEESSPFVREREAGVSIPLGAMENHP